LQTQHSDVDEKQLLALRDSLETLLRGHDHWKGQMTQLKGDSKN